ncbi:BMP family ABC transporter substrate-binding protein [Streptomyces sp. NPDC057428]|uniref:BMP family ABC transporter substrate-binding protein n=1 Tax=Streptomyces sp. NPDC057428 TaxID=3346129 RepID=UPI0036B46E6E
MSSTKTRQGQAAARAKARRGEPSPHDPRRLFAHALRILRRRDLTYAAIACAVAATVVGVIAVTGSNDRRPPIPDSRARPYTETDVCLLTGESGITAGTGGAVVWQGMRDASAETHARVSYTPVTGEQTVGSATPFLNGMLQRSCEVVLASGEEEVAAARLAAPEHPKVRFVLVGGTAVADDGGNVASVRADRAAVAHAVTAAARQ